MPLLIIFILIIGFAFYKTTQKIKERDTLKKNDNISQSSTQSNSPNLTQNKNQNQKSNTNISNNNNNRQQQKPVNVSTTKINKTTMQQIVSLYGELEPYNRAEVSAKTSGIIREINFQLGAKFNKNAVLATLDDEEYLENLKTAELSYKTAVANVEKKRVELNNLKQQYLRNKELSANNLISSETLENIETKYKTAEIDLKYYETLVEQEKSKIDQAKLKLSYTRILAPFSGFLQNILLEKGSYISPGKTIFTIIDISKVKITAYLMEQFYPSIKINQSANIFVKTLNKNLWNYL